MFGACYTEEDGIPEHNQCHCVKKSNKWQIERSLLKGGCQTKQVPGADVAFDGLCVYSSSYAQAAKATTTLPEFNAFGVRITTTTAVPTLPAGEFQYAVGEKIQAQNSKGVWKDAQIVAQGKGKVKVHYIGFNKRFDFWEPQLSSKLKKK